MGREGVSDEMGGGYFSCQFIAEGSIKACCALYLYGCLYMHVCIGMCKICNICFI